ncbi:hypothetical protein J437_LFUL012941 [Ladona fulva]|uniref:Uncharacterized protein n=1 Tax=Ladona fulva TaxID=123851 RepID=A0A8K0KDU4_LADFU|nr:hypothetical protein J437_LFUL012941 [Ladona fulva]
MGKLDRVDALLREFRKIGRDSEYYPESEDGVTFEQKAQCVPLNGNSTDWDKFYQKFLLTEYYPESEESVTFEQKAQSVPSNGNSTEWDKFYHEYLLTCRWSAIQNLAAKPLHPPITQNGWICQFCRNNGESSAFYKTHRLKDENQRDRQLAKENKELLSIYCPDPCQHITLSFYMAECLAMENIEQEYMESILTDRGSKPLVRGDLLRAEPHTAKTGGLRCCPPSLPCGPLRLLRSHLSLTGLISVGLLGGAHDGELPPIISTSAADSSYNEKWPWIHIPCLISDHGLEALLTSSQVISPEDVQGPLEAASPEMLVSIARLLILTVRPLPAAPRVTSPSCSGCCGIRNADGERPAGEGSPAGPLWRLASLFAFFRALRAARAPASPVILLGVLPEIPSPTPPKATSLIPSMSPPSPSVTSHGLPEGGPLTLAGISKTVPFPREPNDIFITGVVGWGLPLGSPGGAPPLDPSSKTLSSHRSSMLPTLLFFLSTILRPPPASSPGVPTPDRGSPPPAEERGGLGAAARSPPSNFPPVAPQAPPPSPMWLLQFFGNRKRTCLGRRRTVVRPPRSRGAGRTIGRGRWKGGCESPLGELPLTGTCGRWPKRWLTPYNKSSSPSFPRPGNSRAAAAKRGAIL